MEDEGLGRGRQRACLVRAQCVRQHDLDLGCVLAALLPAPTRVAPSRLRSFTQLVGGQGAAAV